MSKKYTHLLSPIKINNVIFKNRLLAAPCEPHFEARLNYPSNELITHHANKARDGAALVTVVGNISATIKTQKYWEFHGRGLERHRVETRGEGDFGLTSDLESAFSKLTEAIHFYGSKASMPMGVGMNIPRIYDVSAGMIRAEPTGNEYVEKEITSDMMESMANEGAMTAALIKDLGFDMVYLHMSYRMSLLGRFLSPLTNKRTDKYGGSVENRARFPIMVVDRIKQKCGSDFLIEASISSPKDTKDGTTLEDVIELAKLFSGHIDLLHLRSGDHDHTHPTNYNLERTPFLSTAEAVKKSGVNIAIVATGGFHDPGVCEETIASGKADFISMSRAWISNPDYGRKLYEGRGGDIVPCLRCNKCHQSRHIDPRVSVCSVNPIWGFENEIDRMVKPSSEKKKVAIVGGGPAGMEASLVANSRGHQVTLYEKSDALGGLLKTTNNVSFKWPHKAFKNYLISQIKKQNINVLLNTEATPGMLAAEKYDVVLVALGSEPVVPDIPGVKGKNVFFAQDVYGNENKLDTNVVVIGGGEVGVDTGMHLAENGHQVTVLEIGDILAPKATPIHYYSMFKEAWEKLENFKYILNARCNSISAEKVTYIDDSGKEQSIPVGSVVIAVGLQPNSEPALKFYNSGERFFMIGDCNLSGDTNGVGSIQKVIRSAFGIVSMV